MEVRDTGYEVNMLGVVERAGATDYRVTFLDRATASSLEIGQGVR